MHLRLCFMVLLSMLVGCAHTMIPGTTIEDTEENRSVLSALDSLQKALQARDSDAVIALVSPTYFEDMGTIDNADDFGFDELKTTILANNLDKIAELYLKIDVHAVKVQGDEAYVEIRYRTRAKLDLPSGSTWSQGSDFSRVNFALEDGRWLIASGL